MKATSLTPEQRFGIFNKYGYDPCNMKIERTGFKLVNTITGEELKRVGVEHVALLQHIKKQWGGGKHLVIRSIYD